MEVLPSPSFSDKAPDSPDFLDHREAEPADVHRKNASRGAPAFLHTYRQFPSCSIPAGSVVPFIQVIILDHGNLHLIHFIQNAVSCVDSPLQHRSKTTVKGGPSFFNKRPASLASFIPLSESSTSVQPQNRFFLFHSLSP